MTLTHTQNAYKCNTATYIYGISSQKLMNNFQIISIHNHVHYIYIYINIYIYNPHVKDPPIRDKSCIFHHAPAQRTFPMGLIEEDCWSHECNIGLLMWYLVTLSLDISLWESPRHNNQTIVSITTGQIMVGMISVLVWHGDLHTVTPHSPMWSTQM